MITSLITISLLVAFEFLEVNSSLEDHKHQGAKVQFFNFNPLAGTYDYGYVTNETGQFHQENRGSDGVTVGCYGYVEESGRLRITHYVSDVRGYRVVRPNRPVKVFVSSKNSDPDAYDDYEDIIRTEYRPWSSLFSPRGCRYLISRPTKPATTTTKRPTSPRPSVEPPTPPPMEITARPPITIILNGTITGLDEGLPPSGNPEQDGAAGSLVEGLLGGTDLDLDLNLDQPSQSNGGDQPEQDLPLVGGVLGGLLGGGSSGQSGNPNEGGQPDQQGALTPVVGGLVDGLLGGTDLELDLNLDEPQDVGEPAGQPTQDEQFNNSDGQQGALTPVVGGLVDGLLGGTDLDLDLNLDQPSDQLGGSDQPNQDGQLQNDGLVGGLLGGGSSGQSENPDGQLDPPGILTPIVGALVEGLLGGTDLGLDTNIGRVPSYYLPYLYDVPENIPRIPCGEVDCSKDTFGYLGLTPTVYVSKSLADKLGLSHFQSVSKIGHKMIPMHLLSNKADGSWIAELVGTTQNHDFLTNLNATDS